MIDLGRLRALEDRILAGVSSSEISQISAEYAEIFKPVTPDETQKAISLARLMANGKQVSHFMRDYEQ